MSYNYCLHAVGIIRTDDDKTFFEAFQPKTQSWKPISSTKFFRDFEQECTSITSKEAQESLRDLCKTAEKTTKVTVPTEIIPYIPPRSEIIPYKALPPVRIAPHPVENLGRITTLLKRSIR